MKKYPPEFSTTGPLRALYQAWKDMLNRCDPNGRYRERYKDRYWARGITVCEEWGEWPVFAKWALSKGWSRGLEIDRRDNDRGYSPDNCRFVTDTEQNRNRDMKLVANSIRIAKTRAHAKPFRCVETGEVFLTQIDAQRQCGVDRKSLRLTLAGQYRQAGGFRWAYVEASRATPVMNDNR